MAIETTGKIFKVFETKQITEKFTKREFVLEVEDGKYPQFVLFQFTGDRCANLDGFSEGQEVKCTFNLRGREWTSEKGEVRYFNSLDVWKLDKVGADVQTPGSASPGPVDADAEIPF